MSCACEKTNYIVCVRDERTISIRPTWATHNKWIIINSYQVRVAKKDLLLLIKWACRRKRPVRGYNKVKAYFARGRVTSINKQCLPTPRPKQGKLNCVDATWIHGRWNISGLTRLAEKQTRVRYEKHVCPHGKPFGIFHSARILDYAVKMRR